MAVKSHRLNFVKNFYKSKSLPLSSQRLVNMYAEMEPDDARSVLALFGSPGLTSLVGFGTFFTVYAMKKMGVYLYAVVGNVLYQINDALVATAVGTLTTAPGKVRLSSNGTQLTILTSVGSAWTYTPSTDTFAQITDGDYQLASDVTFIDGYTVFSVQGSDQFFYSDQFDSTAYDALDFQTAEWEPDKLIGIRKVAGELWAFGERTIEIYQNTGGELLFGRINGASMNVGCLVRDSISIIDNTVFWLGDDRFIYAASGYQYKKISNFAIDQEIEGYTINDLEQAISFSYEWQGHKFYVITFPSKNRSFQFDIMTGLWAERESTENGSNTIIRWRANCFETFGRYRVVGDYKTGKLFYMDDTNFTEGEEEMFADIVTSPLFNGFVRTTISALYIDAETGVGTLSGEGSNPKISIWISNNGGRTYSNEITRDLGIRGAYREIVKFTPIGNADNYTFKIRISDPVKKNIFGGYVDFEEGVS
jgi:hypothetical protein